jgi:hypothetical protein
MTRSSSLLFLLCCLNLTLAQQFQAPDDCDLDKDGGPCKGAFNRYEIGYYFMI